MTDYAVFILSHARPNCVVTYKTLRRIGYTGKIYIIIDDEDDSLDEYMDNYKDEVIIFNKNKYIEKTDSVDNFKGQNVVVYARNAVFDIAESLGYEYFIVLDDDYSRFDYKTNENLDYLPSASVLSADRIFEALIEYYKNTDIAALAIAQNGDYIGGARNDIHKSIHGRRKAMNFWTLSIKRRFDFYGRLNEDVNSYLLNGNRGKLFITFPLISLQQETTQENEGGLTPAYLDFGTYVKSFYSVICLPSAVKVGVMGEKYKRLHHSISWRNAVPYIIREEWRHARIDRMTNAMIRQ